MKRTRRVMSALVLLLLAGPAPIFADDQELSAKDRLQKAIGLFDEGDFEQAHELLIAIDEGELEDEDAELQYQRYLSMSERALVAQAEAISDFESGEAAMEAGRLDEALRRLGRIAENPYAPVDLKSQAASMLAEVERRIKAASDQPEAKPVEVKSEEVSQQESPQQESPRIELYVESEPVAVAPSQTTYETVVQRSPMDGSQLVNELALEHELLWQQAVQTYKEAARKLRVAVLKEDFAEARRLLDFAKQTVEVNRRYASPASRYEDYRAQADDLSRYLEDEERNYEERLIREKQLEIKERETQRLELIRTTKQRQVEALMGQAEELVQEQRLTDAIQVYEQVLAIDPQNEQAAWKRDTISDLAQVRRIRSAFKDKDFQFQDALAETTEALIPWHKDINYPKNWAEITAKRTGTEEMTEPEVNRQARKKLSTVAPALKFDAQPFEEVIEQLGALTGLNIVPNWAALEAVGIEKDAEVTLRLQNVTFEKAMRTILETIGAGETELAYEIDEGVIQISTKDDLSRRTIVRVYNIQDLIISVPTFRGRQINLNQIGQNQGRAGGLGGGQFLQGGGVGGGGGGGGGGGQGLFGGGGAGGGQGDDEEQDDTDPLEPIVQLIQQTIDPESWREAGGNVGSIQSLNQQLVVTQTATAHQELRDLLRQLRQSRALQIAVEARYITISRNWLEQIGVDLDVVLNNGNAGFDRTTILDPATNNPVLVPRQFTRLGFTPGAPGNVGINLPTQPFGQPFGQPGLVPATGNVGPASGSFTPIPIVNNTLDLASPAASNVPGSLAGLANSTPAFQIFGSFLDNIQVDFLLRATQIDRRASDLDAPRLVLFNGQRATFEAFIEQDYIAALIPIIGDNAGAFLPVVQTALTGRSLDVQATVSADRRYVTMTVRTFTRVTGDFRTVFFGGSQTVGSGFVELATQTTQQIRTTVSVPDGGTLLIGGLKLAAERDVDAGVPVLSRIPILKRAFSNTSNVKDDQVLLILIKPTIIIQEEAEAEAFPTLSSATGL